MKKIAFLGSLDKTNFVMYIAKILTEANQSVLLVDATSTQKYKYDIPVFNSQEDTDQEVYDFRGFDIAVEFKNLKEIDKFLKNYGESIEQYDYVFLDVDDVKKVEEYQLEKADQVYFTTNFEKITITKNIEVIKQLQERDLLPKIAFSKVFLNTISISRIDKNYIDLFYRKWDIKWLPDEYILPYSPIDYTNRLQVQYEYKVDIKNLTPEYKKVLINICKRILNTVDTRYVEAAVKKAERG